MTHLPQQIGRYEVFGLLGTGGMAEVFLGRGRGPQHDRPVVVKRILPHLARQPHFVDMFRDEARIAAQIRHPNVVEVYELGQAGYELYMVMEYLAGESAAGIARQLAHRKKLLSFGLCAHLMAEACAGLHAAHDLLDDNGDPLHIVHRDVSPANIFVTYQGDVKILDFGIAVGANRLSKTDAGQVKGKYAYMSPEQCRGHNLDRRSDIFSLGTVLFELSTCRRLFKRPTDMQTLEAVCSDSPPRPSLLVNRYPPELERICLKALEKDPELRYPTALAMRRDLLRLARELNGEKLPDVSLAKVMRKLFPDRIEQKKQMLRHLQAGDDMPGSSMPAEYDSMELPVAMPNGGLDSIQLPSAALAEPMPSFVGMTQDLQPEPLPPPPGPTTHSLSYEELSGSAEVRIAPRRPRSLAVALLVLPLLLGLGIGGWWASQRPVLGAKTTQVEVQLDTIPTRAEVYRDGRLLGETPLTVRLMRADDAVELTMRKTGFKELVELVVPNKDQKLRLGLQASATPDSD